MIFIHFEVNNFVYNFIFLFNLNRLVYGSAPKGLKQAFVPELRLLGCVEVDRVFALPLQKDHDLLAVPTNSKIKLQPAKNMEQLNNFIEYSRILEKAQRLLTDARTRLQVVDLKLNEKDNKKESKNSRKLPPLISGLDNGYVLRKSISCDSARHMYSVDLVPSADDYDDIDQIYDYVRGFAPLPKNLNRFTDESIDKLPSTISNGKSSTLKSTDNLSKSQPDSGNYSLIKSNSMNNNSLESVKNSNTYHKPPSLSHHYHHHHHYSQVIPTIIQDDEKPIPPPIETIPGKKLPEKRQRPTLPKLYVKNSCSQNPKSPNGNTPCNGIIVSNKDGLEPQSPLFHIR